jgi:hypothetical protein
MAEEQFGIHQLLEESRSGCAGPHFAFLNFCCDGAARIITTF